MKSRRLSRKRSRTAIISAAAASVVAGVALVPNWSAGAAVKDDPTVDAATKATFQKLADAVFTDRTEALVDNAQSRHGARHQRTAAFSGKVRLSGTQTQQQDSALSQLRGRKSKLAQLGEKYSKGNTTVSLDATQVKGRHATVDVTENTTLTYEKVQPNQPKTTGFQAHHELTFTADSAGTWRLTRVRDTDDGYLAVNQVAAPQVAKPATAADDGPQDAPRAATTRPAPANPKKLTGGTYDYKAMVAYATKYWSNYNPDYPNFNGQGAGGDCTNFVSQSLKAGGWKHVPGYTDDFHKWFGTADIQSDSFIGVNEFSWFALSSKRVTPLANVFQADLGDVIQMDFNKDGSKDHSMIVTSRNAQGIPFVTYHSTNTYNRSVASLVASYPNAAFYAYRT
ncbi:amidase domain-containing protein [Streptomyces sp. J2-1]|uniref:amidase domain-containing protein n=1 Tax=Streptomyces corallincola TaxID=2851888 RepID=UPI001C38C7D3|nr:amidase domain-containing protein [Streptomyces corallincola]MBV2353766.1 amidase domain-containing protein [Streptomyces corallincola]